MKRYSLFTDLAATILSLSLLAALFSSCEGIGDRRENEVFASHAHEWSLWETVSDASCTKSGSIKRSCTLCEETEERSTAALGHSYRDSGASKECTVCGASSAISTHSDKYSDGLKLGINRDHTGYMVMGIGSCNDDTIVVPREYQGFPVTEVNKSAFENCSKLKKIVLPDTVKYIGDKAFYRSSLESIHIPDGVTYIGEYAFSECGNLTSVILPNSLNSFGKYLFYESKNLSEIYLPESIDKIPEYAFAMTAITSLTLPKNVKTVDTHAFWHCEALKHISLPDGLIVLGTMAFSDCTSLEDIVVPETATKLGTWLFAWCQNLKKASIPSGLTSIPDYLFYGCTSLEEITIPDGVISLGNACFSGCRALTEINLPDGIIKINFGAFEGCSSLTTVRIPDKIRGIETMTFSYCTSLTNLYIPASVMNISITAFVNTGDSLTNVVISPDNKYYYSDGSGIYEYYSKSVVQGASNGNIPKDSSITKVGLCAFQGRQNLTEIFIPKNITEIEGSAFEQCPNVTSITYEGTVDEWKKVTLGMDWFTGAELTVVHCSDGDAELIVKRSPPQWD